MHLCSHVACLGSRYAAAIARVSQKPQKPRSSIAETTQGLVVDLITNNYNTRINQAENKRGVGCSDLMLLPVNRVK